MLTSKATLLQLSSIRDDLHKQFRAHDEVLKSSYSSSMKRRSHTYCTKLATQIKALDDVIIVLKDTSQR